MSLFWVHQNLIYNFETVDIMLFIEALDIFFLRPVNILFPELADILFDEIADILFPKAADKLTVVFPNSCFIC